MTSLLLVHGAWHGAWCWEDNVAPWLRDRGHHVTAHDLPFHGARDRTGLRRARVRDYLADLGAAVAALPAPVVVVAHSMGGFVTQRWLMDEHRATAAAILVAPVPVHGALPASLRVARRHPISFLRVNATMNMAHLVREPEVVRDLFFSPTTPARVVLDCHRRLGNESYLAYLDMVAGIRLRPRRVRTPVFVLGAELDGIFAPSEIARTARAYGTEAVILPGGHDMMLDASWELVAERIDTWVRSLA